ncbi:MAG TPA: hypothetical protein VED22_00235 [Nitrososphaerales archaeon]|nr:hypothetical protein [Nitrososphaerales archaeon]
MEDVDEHVNVEADEEEEDEDEEEELLVGMVDELLAIVLVLEGVVDVVDAADEVTELDAAVDAAVDDDVAVAVVELVGDVVVVEEDEPLDRAT